MFCLRVSCEVETEDDRLEDWKRQFDTNVFGVVATVRAALPQLRESRGRLVLMGSVASFVSAPTLGAYSASKFAVRANRLRQRDAGGSGRAGGY